MGFDQHTTLGDRKRQFVTDELSTAAMTLLDRQSYEETTIEQIAAAAGVSRRTYHRYFSTKQEPFVRFFDSLFADMVQTLQNRPEDERVAESLRLTLSSFVEAHAESEKEVVKITNRIASCAPLNGSRLERQHQWAGELAKEIARRTCDDRPDLMPRLLAELTFAALNSAVDHWVALDGSVSLTDLADQAFDVLAKGLNTLER